MIEEIRIEVCRFLHQLFIESPLLIKLVHFQGYSPELLPVTVDGVPSMRTYFPSSPPSSFRTLRLTFASPLLSRTDICLEFVPELLAQPQVEKQIFAIQLAGYLIEKYPLTRRYV